MRPIELLQAALCTRGYDPDDSKLADNHLRVLLRVQRRYYKTIIIQFEHCLQVRLYTYFTYHDTNSAVLLAAFEALKTHERFCSAGIPWMWAAMSRDGTHLNTCAELHFTDVPVTHDDCLDFIDRIIHNLVHEFPPEIVNFYAT